MSKGQSLDPIGDLVRILRDSEFNKKKAHFPIQSSISFLREIKREGERERYRDHVFALLTTWLRWYKIQCPIFTSQIFTGAIDPHIGGLDDILLQW